VPKQRTPTAAAASLGEREEPLVEHLAPPACLHRRRHAIQLSILEPQGAQALQVRQLPRQRRRRHERRRQRLLQRGFGGGGGTDAAPAQRREARRHGGPQRGRRRAGQAQRGQAERGQPADAASLSRCMKGSGAGQGPLSRRRRRARATRQHQTVCEHASNKSRGGAGEERPPGPSSCASGSAAARSPYRSGTAGHSRAAHESRVRPRSAVQASAFWGMPAAAWLSSRSSCREARWRSPCHSCTPARRRGRAASTSAGWESGGTHVLRLHHNASEQREEAWRRAGGSGGQPGCFPVTRSDGGPAAAPQQERWVRRASACARRGVNCASRTVASSRRRSCSGGARGRPQGASPNQQGVQSGGRDTQLVGTLLPLKQGSGTDSHKLAERRPLGMS
jgi:hypothetical protein